MSGENGDLDHAWCDEKLQTQRIENGNRESENGKDAIEYTIPRGKLASKAQAPSQVTQSETSAVSRENGGRRSAIVKPKKSRRHPDQLRWTSKSRKKSQPDNQTTETGK